MNMRLTRQQLYRWVWTTPAERIGEVIGISGSALAKTCQKYDVPTPARGHWRKVQTGQSVPATPLPNLKDIRLTSIEVSDEIAATLSASADSRGTEERAPDAQLAATSSPTSREELAPARHQTPVESPVSADILNSIASRPGVQRSNSSLQPDAKGLRHLAAEFQLFVGVGEALDRLQARLRDLEPGTAATLSIWLLLARRELARLDPVEQIVASCRLVASGGEKPEWWTAVHVMN